MASRVYEIEHSTDPMSRGDAGFRELLGCLYIPTSSQPTQDAVAIDVYNLH